MSAKKIVDSYTLFEVKCEKGELVCYWADKHLAMTEAKAYAYRTGNLVRVNEIEVIRSTKQLANYG